MAAKLFSADFFKKVQEIVNAGDLAEDAPEFSYKFLFYSGDDVKTNIYFDGGKIVEVSEYQPGDEDKADFVIRSDESIWAGIASGKLDTVVHILNGKIELVSGDKMTLVKNLGPAGELFDALTQVEFE